MADDQSALLAHEFRDRLARDHLPNSAQIGQDPRRTVDLVGSRVGGQHHLAQLDPTHSARTRRPIAACQPGVVVRPGNLEQLGHPGDLVVSLLSRR